MTTSFLAGALSVRKLAVQITEKGSERGSKKILLQESSFELPLRSVLGVYGPNGSGKSTLLKNMCGLPSDQERTGEVWIENHLITSEMRAIDRVRSILYLSSDFITPFELTVRELLEMGAMVGSSEIWPVVTASGRGKMSEIIESMNLVPFLARTVNTLSDGEKQLVMFARCLIQSPQVLVLDESFSKLDLDKLLLMTRVMAKEKEKGMTFIVASHDLNFLSEASDQILFLKNASIIAAGTVSEVFTAAQLQALYPDHALHVVKSPESGKNKILY